MPRLLTLIAAFMYRYLFVIVDEARRMRAALAARALPAAARSGSRRALGRLATSLFLRSYARGERVYLAMLARGYRGAMPRLGAARVPARRRGLRRGARAALLVPIRILAEVVA